MPKKLPNSLRAAKRPEPARSEPAPLSALIAVVVLLSLLSWTSSYFYSTLFSDVTVPDWAIGLLGFLTEVLSALRAAVLYASCACLAYVGKLHPLLPLSGILAHTLFGLLSTWLSQGYAVFNPLNMLVDAVLCAAGWLIGRSIKSRRDHTDTSHGKERFSMGRAAVFAALPGALLPLFYSLLDLMDSFDSSLTADVISSVGYILRILLIYAVIGGLAGWLTAEALQKRLRQTTK